MSKRGLKRIEDDLHHEGYNPVIDEGRMGPMRYPRPDGMDLLLRPLNRPNEGREPAAAWSVAIWTAILTFVGTMLFAIIFLLTLDQELTAPSGASALIVALVGGLFTVGPMMWSFDTDLRVHTLPSLIFVSFGTLDLGVLPMIILLAANLGGYAVGGVIARALNGATVLTDPGATTAAYVMTWVATSIVTFVYVYNNKFEFENEYEVDNHSRAARWTGIWSFGFRLALFSLGLRTLNTGLYLAALIYSGGDTNGANWAVYVFVPIFAGAATAFVLYYAASFFVRLRDYSMAIVVNRYRERKAPDYTQVDARVPSRYGAQVRKRNLDATF